MVHQQMQPPVQYAEKHFDIPASKSYSTLDQHLDTAQTLWADWWENGVYQQPKRRHEPKRVFIGSGEDVCLEML